MAENTTRQQWIDRYVRNDLTVEEITEFELALMESPQMQKGLEAVLGLREALLLEPDPRQETGVDDLLPESLSGGGNWRSLAMMLDIELNPASRRQQSLGFALLDEAGIAS